MRFPALITALLTALSAPPLSAQGWIDIERPRPWPAIRPPEVVRISSAVRATLEGRVARVEVEERFRNAGGVVAEGSYLYPLPGEAVFTDFSLWMGEREVRGEMMNAAQAQSIYEEIVRRLRDPALLQLAGHGLVRARVFPIQPGETRRVVLRYTQLLQRAGDAIRLRYAIGERTMGTSRGLGDRPPERPADAFSFRVTAPNADAYGTPYSPTHRVTTRRVGSDLEITLDSAATGDVELFIPLRRGLVGTSIVTHAPGGGGEDGFFMLLLSPPDASEAAAVPRDLSLVVDVSGSMAGDKLEQAKAALRQALGTLGPADRFRLIAFSSTVRRFGVGFAPATAESVRAAAEFVETLSASGGTNIAGALDAVLGTTAEEGRLPLVMFLTDGLPTVGEQAPDRIAELLAGRIGRARIFTVGVGYDVNTYLLDRLAAEGRGSAEYVRPDASVETAVGALLAKLRYPALTNLRIERAPVRLLETQPAALPDLFYGEELVVFGRYRGEGSGEVVLSGERGGRRERFTAAAAFPAAASDNDFIPRLWAGRRIGELTRQIRLEGATPSLIEQVRELALRYGILTEYTSYLVQEPMTVAGVRSPAMPMDQALRGGAGAARAQTGRRAFRIAEASAAFSTAANIAAADRAAEERLGELVAERPSRAARRVAGRLFVRNGTVWTDAAHRDSLKVVEVAAFSDAYFALARSLPEIAPYVAALGRDEEMVIAGRRVSMKIGPSGLTDWRAGQLEAVVRAFRRA